MFRSLKFLRNITVCSILLFTVNSAGQSIVVKDDTNLLNASEDFINRASSLLDQDTIFAYKKAEQAITDEVSQENLERIYLALEYYYTLEDQEKILKLAEQLEKVATQLDSPSFIRLAAVYRSYCIGLGGAYVSAIAELEKQLKTALKLEDNLVAITIYDALMGLGPEEG